MPVLTSLSLLSSTASGLIQAAGHVADALESAKSKSGKKSDSPNQAQDTGQLANLFAAYLAAAAHSATGQGAPLATSPSAPQNGPVKSAKDVSSALSPLSVVLALGPTTAITASMALHPAQGSAASASKTANTPALAPGATSTVPAAANLLHATSKQIAAPAAKTGTPSKGTHNAPPGSLGEHIATATAKGTQKGVGLQQRDSVGSPSGLTPTGQEAIPASHQATAEVPVLALHDVPVSTTQENAQMTGVSQATATGTRAASPNTSSSQQSGNVSNTAAAVLPVPKVSAAVATAQTQFVGWSESTKATNGAMAGPKTATDSTNSTGTASGSQPASPPPASTPIVTAAGTFVQMSGNSNATELNNSQTSTPIAEQLSRALVSQASVASHEGRTDFHLRLQPPQLGSVQIHLTAMHDKVSARVVVVHEETRQLLVGQAHQLRQSLAESGLVLGSFDVSREGGGASQGGYQQPPEMPQPPTTGSAPPTVSSFVKSPQSISTDGIDILA